MSGIFISYRRDDAEGYAALLFEGLKTRFGKDLIFMDVVGIDPGKDFRQAIDDAIASSDVVLALIGKRWADATGPTGDRRLNDPQDFVRLETATALKRNLPLIPVLVQGAEMPRPEELPEDLEGLAWRNAFELRHDRWDTDIALLISKLEKLVKLPVGAGPTGATAAGPTAESQSGDRRRFADRRSSLVSWLGLAALVIAATVAGFLFSEFRQPTDNKPITKVKVPNLKGASLVDAINTLTKNKLAFRGSDEEYVPGSRPFIVHKHFPHADEEVGEGTGIYLIVTAPERAADAKTTGSTKPPPGVVAEAPTADSPTTERRLLRSIGSPPDDASPAASTLKGAVLDARAAPPRLAPPAQTAPADGATFDIFPRATALRWQPVEGAAGYSVEVDCFHCCGLQQWCSDKGKTWLLVPDLPAASTAFNFNFVGAQPGRWRVWAVNAQGGEGEKSPWRSFTYTK